MLGMEPKVMLDKGCQRKQPLSWPLVESKGSEVSTGWYMVRNIENMGLACGVHMATIHTWQRAVIPLGFTRTVHSWLRKQVTPNPKHIAKYFPIGKKIPSRRKFGN